MAGSGTRTSDKYSTPKPLIMVKNEPLFSWAIKGLPLELASELTVVTNRLVATNENFDRHLATFVPKQLKINLEVLEEQTSGQAETVLLGTKKINNDKGLLIFNCDTYISDDFPRNFQSWDGMLGYFKSSNPAMSYLQTTGEEVNRTIEKEVISDKASTGLYYFASREMFVDAFHDTSHQQETYIAPMYNSMIQKGYRVGSFPTKTVIPLGTSQDILAFERNKKAESERA